MENLTIIMPTINSVPLQWAEYHRKTLLEAANEMPIITISKIPMDWGVPNVINILQEVPPEDALWERTCNVYTQILKGAKLAKTPYVAVAEDDCLYPRKHFIKFRPDLNTFAYNHTRWCIFSWERRRPFYYQMPTDANCLMIAPRGKLIKALEGWTDKTYLEDPHQIRKVMHHLQEPCISYNTFEPVLCFYHDKGNDSLERSHKKKPWPIIAYQIPRWGKAKQAIQLWR